MSTGNDDTDPGKDEREGQRNGESVSVKKGKANRCAWKRGRHRTDMVPRLDGDDHDDSHCI